MLSFAPLYGSLFAFLSIKEIPSNFSIAGMVLIVIGAFLLNAKRSDLKNPLILFKSFAQERGSLLMLVVAALWGSTSLTDKISLSYTTVPKHALVQTVGVVLVLVAIAGL